MLGNVDDSDKINTLSDARFSLAATGYAPTDVHRLIGDLRMALRKAEPLAPIIDTRILPEVSYGYDRNEVRSILDQAKGWDTDLAESAPASETAPDADPPYDPSALPSYTAPGDDELPDESPDDDFESGDPSEWSFPATDTSYDTDAEVPAPVEERDAAAEMLYYLDRARFRVSTRANPGYDMGEVDRFIERLRDRVEAGESMGELIHGARFPLSTRDGYVTEDVDVFLDGLEAADAGDLDALDRVSFPLQERSGPGCGWFMVGLLILGVILFIVGAVFL